MPKCGVNSIQRKTFMTVNELIEELKKYPSDMQVRTIGGRNMDTTEIVLLKETRFSGILDVVFITGE